MRLTAQVKLIPAPSQQEALYATLLAANEAANYLSHYAWEHKQFGQWTLHKLCYRDLRERFHLSAQLTVRVIGKVAQAYKKDHKCLRFFRPTSGVPYDCRILGWQDNTVSIWTLEGRQTIPFVCGDHHSSLLLTQRGESDLLLRGGRFYLHTSCEVVVPERYVTEEFVGVDLGIVNIATDSDGEVHSGATLNGLRRRHRRLRKKLQKKGTKAARRVLKKRRKKEARFARDINHCLSKRIVAKAQGTGRGIALEELKGILKRVTVRRPQRAALHSWSFAQLGAFLIYKAALAGVPLVFVDPRNTSRTCPICGHIAKGNRKTQSQFSCRSCGHSGLADHIAAINISNVARWGSVNSPDVTSEAA